MVRDALGTPRGCSIAVMLSLAQDPLWLLDSSHWSPSLRSLSVAAPSQTLLVPVFLFNVILSASSHSRVSRSVLSTETSSLSFGVCYIDMQHRLSTVPTASRIWLVRG